MSDSRVSLRIASCLLIAGLFGASDVSAQAIGSGVRNSYAGANPTRGGVVPAEYVPQHERVAQRPAPTYLTQDFVSPAPRSKPVNEPLVPVPMPDEALGNEVIMDDPGVHDEFAGDFHGEHPDGCVCGGHGCELCSHGVWALLAGARERSEVYYGVTSFSGPVNRGGTGSFGFEGGLNMGSPFLGGWRGIGFQMGFGGAFTNFNGANFTIDNRNQFFGTIGLFRRVDWGLQWGFVVDQMHDDWYAAADLTQARGEFSWVVPQGSEIGFCFAASDDFDVVTGTLQTPGAIPTAINETWQVNDTYGFFLRHTFCEGGQARIFAGWSGTSDGVLGADALIPFNDQWSLRNSFTYLIPQEGPLDGGNVEESWNLSMLLVWSPCRSQCGNDYYRPLFNVANNGTFFVDR